MTTQPNSNGGTPLLADFSHPKTFTPSTEPPADALVDSIRAELQEMLSRPLTHLTLDAAARYCFAASKLLMNRTKAKKNLRAGDAPGLMQPFGSMMGGGMVSFPDGDMIDVDDPSVSAGPMLSDGVIASAPQSETYGVRAMRELMEALGKMQEKKSETPESLVKAIAEARALGMHDLVKQLCERLGVAPPADSPPNPKKRKRRKQ